MRKPRWMAATAMIPMLAGTAVTLAQTAPPSPSLTDRAGPPAWAGYLIMFLLFAIVIAISLMPSKRSHQD